MSTPRRSILISRKTLPNSVAIIHRAPSAQKMTKQLLPKPPVRAFDVTRQRQVSTYPRTSSLALFHMPTIPEEEPYLTTRYPLRVMLFLSLWPNLIYSQSCLWKFDSRFTTYHWNLNLSICQDVADGFHDRPYVWSARKRSKSTNVNIRS